MVELANSRFRKRPMHVTIALYILTKKRFQMPNEQASRFLSLLDPTASAFTFQTVPEPKGKHSNLWPQVLHGSLNE